MYKEVENSKAYIFFFFTAIVLCCLSILPVAAFRIYSWTTYIIPVSVFLGTFLYAGICRPNYFNILMIESRLELMISFTQEDKIIIHSEGFEGYKITSKMWGLMHKLELYKQSKYGIMKTQPFYISLLTKEKRQNLVLMLEYFKKISK